MVKEVEVKEEIGDNNDGQSRNRHSTGMISNIREKDDETQANPVKTDRQTVELDYLMSWVQLSLVEEGEKEKDHRTEGSRGNVMKKFVQKISNDFYCQ